MSATQDFVALEWIRGELENTLENAQVSLEAAAESSDDPSSMRSCLTAIHQVHGTLKMVQLEGPTMVAAEMEQVAQSLMNSAVPDQQLALETLMQAILQLPAYLDRIHREQTDAEKNYLPMVNNLRTARGEEKLPGDGGEEEGESGIDLSPLTNSPGDDVINAYFQADGEGNLPKVSLRFKRTLAAIFKKKDVRENLTMLGKLFTMLDKLCGDSPMGNLADIGLAMVEGIAAGAIKLDNQTAGLLREMDGVIARLAEEGQAGLSTPVDETYALSLIELIGDATKETKRISEIRKRYASDVPEPEDVAMGPDDETMSAVARILIEELNVVTDKLDLYVRAQNRDSAELVSLLPNLEQIASTMVILGDTGLQSTVTQQIAVVKEIETGNEPDEEMLLEMAQALLGIEARMSALVLDGEEGAETDNFANIDEAQAAVIRETRNGLASSKDSVIEYIASEFAQDRIKDLPERLRALRGGLMIVNQLRAGDVLEAAAHYVEQELMAKQVTPELEHMDDLADAITSVDYYLERLLENAADPYLQMLEVAESSVAKLGYAVGTEVAPVGTQGAVEKLKEADSGQASGEEVTPDIGEDDETGGEESDAAASVVEVEEEVEDEIELEEIELEIEEGEEISAEADEELSADALELDTIEDIEEETATEVDAETESESEVSDSAELIDEEILEIFVEEVDEVLETINEFLPAWESNPGDGDALAEVRRAFHTLKGSGRMVGATVVGELAWSIENLLNRVIEKAVEVTPSVFSIVSQVTASVPEGVEAFKRGQQNDFTPDSMVAVAESLAEGGDVSAEEAAAGETPEEPAEIDLDEIAIEAGESSVEESEFELDEIETEEDAGFELEDVEDALAFEEVETEEPEAEDFEVEEIGAEEIEALEVEDETASDSGDAVISEEALLESDDLSLDQIFAIEADEKLAIIESFNTTGGAVTGDLVAAFHTLKGSAAMAEIVSIAGIAAPMEQLANDYLVRNQDADDHLINLSAESARLMRLVLEDLDAHREAVDGADALLAMMTPLGTEETGVFDFSNIVLLSKATIASDSWQDSAAVVSELQNTLEQAESLGQPALVSLVGSMLRIYEGAESKPEDVTLSLMKRAHDHLVIMFDALASSQPVLDADEIVEELDALDLSAPVASDPAIRRETESEPESDTEQAALAGAEATELPEDDIDEDILPIFLEETEELLESLDESINGWAETGEPGEHLDMLLRQLHTLKGGARMAGLASLGEYTHNFETLLIGVQSNPVQFDDEFFALLNSHQDEIIRRVEIYQKVAAGSASDTELASMKTAAAPPSSGAPARVTEETAPADVPAASGPVGDAVVELPEDEVDEDILPIFLEESDDLVEELEESIQNWSESPGDTEIHDLLLRNLHTLKGGARMAGLNSLGEYAHNFETFLIGLQQNPVELDDEFFALLARRQDEVIRRVEIYKKLSVGAASEPELASLKTAIEPSLDGDSVAAPSAATPAEEAQDAEPEGGDAHQDKAASAAQEMIRVSADLMEDLIGLAGESSINRGRIEQQIGDFGDALDEMEETIYRIRDQVRRLEIEAESRETLIQTHQGDGGDSAFDELEMDRYTMLQEISRALNEGSSDMLDLKDTLVNRSRDAETLLHQQARVSGELQEGLTRTRMVPFVRLIPRLRRIVRQISGEVGKSVRFDAYNVEGELDRNVLERIVAPLEHMLRNAVDHGIEDAEARVAAGKPEQGRISLRLSREGGYVVLIISDDGGGIAVDAVRKKAIERGLITEGQDVSDHEVMQFIMHAGFSTAQKLTQISGRGVGMDVVGSEIKSLGGSMTIDSTLGVGTEFTIRIPFTVSINRALMVVVREENYAIPLNTIEGIVRVSPYELEAYYQPDAPMFEYAGQPYRLAYMGKMLDNAEDPNLTGQVAPLPVILARSGDHSVALQVDRVIGSREVVVKTLGAQFDDVGGISGATVLGDGGVVIILDCMALVRSYEESLQAPLTDTPEVPLAEAAGNVRTVMIVDDSVTVRKVTSRLMERHGFQVITAKDGLDAMDQLQDVKPDVMLLDIEMPRMDGFEVLRSVRRNEELKDLPIIMITSRTGEKHKQQAMELGVNQYLGKPFQEANLLETIDEVIAGSVAGSQE
jgi:chemosensory pili system protein ChpA (sensor histidine kinase/response regulator)